RADLEFVLPGPEKRVPRRQLESLRNGSLGLLDVPADVPGRRIDVDIAGELTVLITDHRRAWCQRDLCELTEWDLRAGRRLDQNAFQVWKIVAKSALVPDVDWIAFPALDRAGI